MLLYNKAFTDVVDVTLQADRIGNQLSPPADVKLRGLVVGTVREVSSTGDGATIELALDPDKVGLIPQGRAGPAAAQDAVRREVRRPRRPRPPVGAALCRGRRHPAGPLRDRDRDRGRPRRPAAAAADAEARAAVHHPQRRLRRPARPRRAHRRQPRGARRLPGRRSTPRSPASRTTSAGLAALAEDYDDGRTRLPRAARQLLRRQPQPGRPASSSWRPSSTPPPARSTSSSDVLRRERAPAGAARRHQPARAGAARPLLARVPLPRRRAWRATSRSSATPSAACSPACTSPSSSPRTTTATSRGDEPRLPRRPRPVLRGAPGPPVPQDDDEYRDGYRDAERAAVDRQPDGSGGARASTPAVSADPARFLAGAPPRRPPSAPSSRP